MDVHRERFRVLFAVIVLIAAGSLVAYTLRGTPEAQEQLSERMPPRLTERGAAILAESEGFQHLVGYTARGFEPKQLVIQQGETVRFSNNSSEQLWLAAEGSSPYPGLSECGGSALDTCAALDPGEFWEFTFDAAGTWGYRNNVDTSKSASIVIEVL